LSGVVLFGLSRTLPLAAEKVVVHPFLLRFLGPDAFGSFVLALGVVMLLVGIPGGGIQPATLREHARFENRRKDAFFRAGVAVAVSVVGLVCLVLVVFAGEIAGIMAKGSPRTAEYIRMLSLYALVLGCLLGLQVVLRAYLKFGQLLLGSLFTVLGFILVILLVMTFGRGSVGLSYAAGPAGGLLFTAFLLRRPLAGRPWLYWSDLRIYARTSPFFMGTAAIGFSQTYLSRLYLGAHVPLGQVACFFAGNAVALLFAQHAGMMGAVAFSYVARKKSIREVHRGALLRYLALTGLFAFLTLAAGLLLGPLLLRLLYPAVVTGAAPVFAIRIVGVSCAVPRYMMVGIAQKFLRRWLTAALNAASLAINLGLLILLVPGHGIRGAAWATVGADLMSGAAYVMLALFLISRAGSGPERS